MSKLQAALTSLVAIVPAGLLMFVLVTGMMSMMQAEAVSGALMGTVVLVLVCCLGVLFTPILVFITSNGGEVESDFDTGADDFADPDDEFGTVDEFGDEGGDDEFDEAAETLVSDDIDDLDGDDFGDDEWGDEEEWDEEEEDDEWA